MSFLLSCALVAGSMFLFGLAIDDFYLRLLFKPIPQVCLLVWLFSQEKNSYRNILSLGLISCIIADILLEFRQLYFLQGVIIFLIGHIFYIYAFIKRNSKPNLHLLIPFATWGVIIFMTIQSGLGKMYYPVLAYTLVICLMMWRAACLSNMGYMALVGAVMFAFGDTLIAIDRFFQPIEGARYPIIVSYWLAQFCIITTAKKKLVTKNESVSTPITAL
ncbi:MAG: hypothetical protein CME61_07385 [Halobacteriovoraceae bacterium]|nr:hypothetical protein [Halobacteriovoraceae bacterium]|tara:strand:+ start:891 stop:1544 length:654 start_codon:yes stop_codon:yes gene_type:complete